MAEKVKNQLHQLLSVENDRKQKASLIINETINTFNKKPEHFDGLVKVYSSFDDNGEVIPAEIKEIVTTVKEKLDYAAVPISAGIDAQISKEETNASGTAKADLIVEDKSLGIFSATSLLALESWVTKIREIYKEIPTLDPTKIWEKDSESGEGRFKTSAEQKIRTNKINEPLVLYPATDKHPAQVQMITKDIQVGKYETVYKSGKVTPAQKARILERVDILLDAIKQARAKANTADVVNVNVGSFLFDYINGNDLN